MAEVSGARIIQKCVTGFPVGDLRSQANHI